LVKLAEELKTYETILLNWNIDSESLENLYPIFDELFLPFNMKMKYVLENIAFCAGNQAMKVTTSKLFTILQTIFYKSKGQMKKP